MNFKFGSGTLRTLTAIAKKQTEEQGKRYSYTQVIEDAVRAYAAALGVTGKVKP